MNKKNVNVQKGKKGFQPSVKHINPTIPLDFSSAKQPQPPTGEVQGNSLSSDYGNMHKVLTSLTTSNRSFNKNQLKETIQDIPITQSTAYQEETHRGHYTPIAGYDEFKFGGKGSPHAYAAYMSQETWMHNHPQWSVTVWKNNSDGTYSVEDTYDRIVPASSQLGYDEPGIIAFHGEKGKYIPSTSIYDLAYAPKSEDDPSYNYTYERNGKNWIATARKENNKWIPIKN